VSQINQRLAEVARMGFTACVLPHSVRGKLQTPKALELIHVKTITDAISRALS
jgi:predicted ATP-dependent serine protease